MRAPNWDIRETAMSKRKRLPRGEPCSFVGLVLCLQDPMAPILPAYFSQLSQQPRLPSTLEISPLEPGWFPV